MDWKAVKNTLCLRRRVAPVTLVFLFNFCAILSAQPSAPVTRVEHAARDDPAPDLTVISRRTSAHRVSVRSFGAVCDGIRDDSAAIAGAAAAMRGTGAVLLVPNDCRVRLGGAAQVVLDGVTLAGDGGRDSGQAKTGLYGTRGGTILITDTAKSPFIVERNWGIRSLIFFWPSQIEDASAPRMFPALMTGNATQEISAGQFEYNDVINATVIGDFSRGFGGGYEINGNRGFCLSTCWRLRSMPLESFVSNNDWTPNPFQNVVLAKGTSRLRDYAARHASVFEIVGDGSATSPSAASVDGLNLSNNYTFGFFRGIRILGGTLNLLSGIGNSFDAVARVVSVEKGGRILQGNLLGGQWYPYTFGSATSTEAPLYAQPDAAPGNGLSVTGVTVPASVASLADWEAPQSNLSLVNVRAAALNTRPGGTASGIIMNSAGGQLTIVASLITMQGDAAGACIKIMLPLKILTVVGNQFISCEESISINGLSGPTGSVLSGNTSVATRGIAAIAGPMATTLQDVGNSWDKPTPGWQSARRGADGALIFSFNGVVQLSISPTGALRTAGAVASGVMP